MGNKNSILLHPADFLFTGVDTMSHDGAAFPAKHAEMIVGISVKFRPWAELLHPGNLSRILR